MVLQLGRCSHKYWEYQADNGWYNDAETMTLRPITSSILPAPASIIELVKCQCKGKCHTKLCSCKGNSLPYKLIVPCASVKTCVRINPRDLISMMLYLVTMMTMTRVFIKTVNLTFWRLYFFKFWKHCFVLMTVYSDIYKYLKLYL